MPVTEYKLSNICGINEGINFFAMSHYLCGGFGLDQNTSFLLKGGGIFMSKLGLL